eukprot:s1218_g1.t1
MQVPALPVPREASVAAVLGGQIVVCGGFDGHRQLNQAERFDPVAGSLTGKVTFRELSILQELFFLITVWRASIVIVSTETTNCDLLLMRGSTHLGSFNGMINCFYECRYLARAASNAQQERVLKCSDQRPVFPQLRLYYAVASVDFCSKHILPLHFGFCEAVWCNCCSGPRFDTSGMLKSATAASESPC